MATTPEKETTGRTHVGESARVFMEGVRVAVVGSPFASLRAVFLLISAGSLMTAAPQPFAALGVALVTAIAYEWGRKR